MGSSYEVLYLKKYNLKKTFLDMGKNVIYYKVVNK